MKNIYPIALLLCCLLVLPGVSRSQCYELVWSEEFDVDGLPDELTWTAETGGTGWGNNELQYYKAGDLDNSRVEDGRLIITAIKETYMGRNYTSTRLITKNKVNFKYGKVEARMKLPYGQGIWPAFWMMGESISEVGWPACGEIDVMEMIGGNGRENTVHGTIHWDNNGAHAYYGGSKTLASGTFADDYHVFSVEWTPAKITWFLDGTQYHVVDITPAALSEFHQEFFLLLNLAVGGNWPGNPDLNTVFPQTLEVDYIRVYQQNQTPAIKGPKQVTSKTKGSQYTLPYSPTWVYEWAVPGGAEIVAGQGTNQIEVNWGCNPGEIQCNLTGTCNSYALGYPVEFVFAIDGPMFAAEGETGVYFSASLVASTTYQWSVPADADITSGQNTRAILVDWGSTFEPVTLSIENECGVSEFSHRVLVKGQYPYPDPLVAHAIPGVINATHYDYGGPGVSYHDTSIQNEGAGPRSDESVDTQVSDNGSPNVG